MTDGSVEVLFCLEYLEKLLVINAVFLLFSFFTGKVIPNDRVHPRLWKGSNRKFRFIPRQKNEIKKQNKVSAIVQTNRTVVLS